MIGGEEEMRHWREGSNTAWVSGKDEVDDGARIKSRAPGAEESVYYDESVSEAEVVQRAAWGVGDGAPGGVAGIEVTSDE